ncbi:hypothetical protein [Thiothrix subterranea]|uniref:Uncharacterized protein n=1 Tax=Thiothrix subterranea TaxID=2735563 RepID=A0AA51MKK8_9GAMM|nr:hypothetical protein [Thiothrix subterranea]MDQ5770972.1 hypothetical protein [Thiothrix subterranea]WML85990.1 hypothetical protein RCG00_17020 [Thiothrix subterranea]
MIKTLGYLDLEELGYSFHRKGTIRRIGVNKDGYFFEVRHNGKPLFNGQQAVGIAEALDMADSHHRMMKRVMEVQS